MAVSNTTLVEARGKQVSTAHRSLSTALSWQWLVLGGLFLCSALPTILRGFWVDEANTFWMSHEGPLAAIRKAQAWPGQSILYAFIASFFTLPSGPLREAVLRLPSLAAIVVAGYFVFRIGNRLFGPPAGFAATALFLLAPTTIEIGLQARAYGLAMAAAAGSFWFLIRWLDSRKLQDLALYSVTTALLFYFHYLFAALMFAHALVAAQALLGARRWRDVSRLLAAWIATLLLTAPLWQHFLLLLKEAHTLPFLPKPLWHDLLWETSEPFLLFGLLVTGFAIRYLRPEEPPQDEMPSSTSQESRTRTVLLASWWLLIPVIFFAASVLTGSSYFASRYICFFTEGYALVLTGMGLRLLGRGKLAAWILIGATLTSANPAFRLARARHPWQEDLRPLFQAIHSESQTSRPPVFFSSELPESIYYDWRAGLSPKTYLFSPFVVYPIPNRLLPLPFIPNAESKAYFDQMLDTDLKRENKIVFITRRDSWFQWATEHMKLAGFSARITHPNAFYIVVFERPS